MKDKLISLNVLRGVAAMLVVLYHMEVLQDCLRGVGLGLIFSLSSVGYS